MKNQMRLVRLQKVIADCGVTSRRKAEMLIITGKVQVNDVVVTELGTKVDPYKDIILVNQQVLDIRNVQKHYIVLNKPRGYVTTTSDPEGRETVLDLVKEFSDRIYPVGRLDYLSEGLMILTNDGEVANSIIHPKFNLTKVYEVKVFGQVSEDILKKIKQGIWSEGEFLKPESVRVIKFLPKKTWLEFRLKAGRNREIRRLCESCGLSIDKLKRLAIGGLTIAGIPIGKYDMMSKKQLLNAIGMDEEGNLVKDLNFISEKKSLWINPKKFSNNIPMATDDTYIRYRKKYYTETVKKQAENSQVPEKPQFAEKPKFTTYKKTPVRSNYRKKVF